jgi:hypothetical protein
MADETELDDENSSITLRGFLQPEGCTDQGRRVRLNKHLSTMGFKFDVTLITTHSKYAGVRRQLIQFAKNMGEKI